MHRQLLIKVFTITALTTGVLGWSATASAQFGYRTPAPIRKIDPSKPFWNNRDSGGSTGSWAIETTPPRKKQYEKPLGTRVYDSGPSAGRNQKLSSQSRRDFQALNNGPFKPHLRSKAR